MILIAACFRAPAQADVAFTVTSPQFRDGDQLSSAYAYGGNDAAGLPCGGTNVSPPLAWSNAPAGTRSFALVVYDPDGARGEGVVHWVAVGIPLTTTSLAEGAGTAGFTGFRAGASSDGTLAYRGICPPREDADHHYVMTVFALDLAPEAVPSGLTRAALLDAIRGHILRAASIVGRFHR